MSHQDSYDIRSSRALADYDIAQRFVIGYVYELPFGKGRLVGNGWNRPVNLLLGGWQVNGITTFQSGTPLGITANNVAGLFNPTGRASNNGKSGGYHCCSSSKYCQRAKKSL